MWKERAQIARKVQRMKKQSGVRCGERFLEFFFGVENGETARRWVKKEGFRVSMHDLFEFLDAFAIEAASSQVKMAFYATTLSLSKFSLL